MNPDEKKTIKNTFLPEFVNKKFSVEMLTDMLRIVPISRYPPEIQELVRNELGWRRIQESLR